MRIESRKGALLQVNMYRLIEGDYALVIDPCPDPTREELTAQTVDAIVLTHEHYDHICGAALWREQCGAPVWCARTAKAGMEDPKINMSHYGTVVFEMTPMWDERARSLGEITDFSITPDELLEDGQTIAWRGNTIRVMETPGHSPGSTCFLVNEQFLFCGDVLLAEKPTGVRWKGASRRKHMESLASKLRSLSEEITVYPGHGEPFFLRDYTFWEETM